MKRKDLKRKAEKEVPPTRNRRDFFEANSAGRIRMPWFARSKKDAGSAPSPAPAPAAVTAPQEQKRSVTDDEMAKIQALLKETAKGGDSAAEALKQRREKEEKEGVRKVDPVLREQIRLEREAKEAAMANINVWGSLRDHPHTRTPRTHSRASAPPGTEDRAHGGGGAVTCDEGGVPPPPPPEHAAHRGNERWTHD